jgi:probable F420-dependent oxidoreductase
VGGQRYGAASRESATNRIVPESIFQFGVVSDAADLPSLRELARRAEAAGYDILASSDHLDLSGAHMARLSPFAALGAAAAVTAQLRLATSVLNQDLRHPAVVAQEAASLDALSGGRVQLGIGAGWNELEYRWAGIAYDPIGTRIARLAEYLDVVRGLLRNETFSYTGAFFTIDEMPGVPRPLPLMVGGTGPRILRLAGRTADIVSVQLLKTERMSAAELDERVDWVRAAAGDRRVTLNTMPAGVLPGDGERVEIVRRAIADGSSWGVRIAARRLTPEQIAASPAFLIGTPAQMAEDLLAAHERWGISHLIVPASDLDNLAPAIARVR